MSGKRTAVVGGCGGIGRSVVERLIAQGDAVVVLDLAESIAAAPPVAGVRTIAFDGRDREGTAAAIEMLAGGGALDGLVITSGYAGQRRSLAETPLADIDDVLAGNLMLPLLFLRAVPRLFGRAGGAVVLVSTDMVYAPQPGYGAYVAAKAGVIGLARVAAKELAPAVRVNLVAPGAVDTPFLRGGLGRGADPKAPLRFDPAAYLAQVPLGRMGEADDVADPILFLLSDASRYMTGEVLHLSGGAVMA